MAGPFPGMDPYLEGEMWQEFHQTLAHAIRAQLMPLLFPKYVALLNKRFAIEYPASEFVELSARSIYPDIHVATSTLSGGLQPMPSSGNITAPTIELPSYEEVPQLSVEIRDTADRQLVTVIEILSPANKIGAGAREYQERRLSLSRAVVHLLEIDLLRIGTRIGLHGTPPGAPYYAYLSRWERRPYTQIWAIQLRDRLPTVPVPLISPDPDVSLDLQAAIVACFDLVKYDFLLRYDLPIPPPDLSPDDAAWVASRLEAFRAQRQSS
jgi:hypothetical protein